MKKLLYILALISFSITASAQEKDWGRVSASLESTNHFYVDDEANNFVPSSGYDPELQYLNGGRFATNDYLKVDYYKGRISAGMQLEGYFPTTVGYPYAQNKLSISNLYCSWTDSNYSVTAGSFYEQLGSGLLFRSWEDRALGLNNAIVGARATYNYDGILSAKVFAGVPRLDKLQKYSPSFFGLGLAERVCVAAADAFLSISEVFGLENILMSIEGSMLYKYDNLYEKNEPYFYDFLVDSGLNQNSIGWSGRFSLESAGFYVKGEYVDAGKNYYLEMKKAVRGNAQLFEFGYNQKGLGVSFTGRRVYRMTQQIVTAEITKYATSANVLSYCPAMCTQYTYMLATLNPYNPINGMEVMYGPGEYGGQIDAFYNFRRGTKIGGKRGMKIHANLSAYCELNPDGGFIGGKYHFLDFSADLEKQWTKKFKSTVLYSLQDYKKKAKNFYGEEVHIGMSHTVVADLLYKWTPKFSTRLELQYLASKDYQKDWMAALLEVSFAPSWSVFASDMYNHGDTKMHYYNAGVSYAYQWFRVAAGYGRYRAGYICSGGVCRKIPAYTGANLTLTASF